jgi:arsenite-transporting ATPase
MGLGMVADQLKELKLGELLDTPPPGLDEAVAISKVVQFVNSQVRRQAAGRRGGCLLAR